MVHIVLKIALTVAYTLKEAAWLLFLAQMRAKGLCYNILRCIHRRYYTLIHFPEKMGCDISSTKNMP